jgi:hypothetical protein
LAAEKVNTVLSSTPEGGEIVNVPGNGGPLTSTVIDERAVDPEAVRQLSDNTMLVSTGSEYGATTSARVWSGPEDSHRLVLVRAIVVMLSDGLSMDHSAVAATGVTIVPCSTSWVDASMTVVTASIVTSGDPAGTRRTVTLSFALLTESYTNTEKDIRSLSICAGTKVLMTLPLVVALVTRSQEGGNTSIKVQVQLKER